MVNRRLDTLFHKFPDNYPHILKREHPRVLQRLLHLWDQPEDFTAYMQELLISSRSDRKGFPLDVLTELMFLGKLHETCHRQNISLPPLDDPWKQFPPANRTPQSFLYALQRGDVAQVRMYLDGDIPVDYHFEDGGGTPLAVAAAGGQTAVAELLLHAGADIRARDGGGYTPLHWAAFYGHEKMAALLLRHHARIDATQNTNSTPLALAVVRNHIGMVVLLLEHGANAKLSSREGTPLEIAVKKGANDIVTLLRRKTSAG